MERLNYHVYSELQKAFEVSVSGPHGCEAYLAPGTRHASFPPRPLWRFVPMCMVRTLALAGRERPDLVFSGSGVTAPAALVAARRLGVPAMTYVHGLDLVAPHLLYQYGFVPAIRRCDAVIANSRHTALLARQRHVPESRIHVLNPGVSLPEADDVANGQGFRRHIHAGERPVLLSVGRLTARKGVAEFVERCMPRLVARKPEVLLVVVGGEATQALAGGAGDMTEKIRAVARAAGVENHVLLLGELGDDELSQAYAASRVLVFPVLERPHDVEGFGMVAVEAAAHGVPTVGFAVGGVPDAVKDGVSGRLVASGDYAALADAILRVLDHPGEITSESARAFAASFSWGKFGERLRSVVAPLVR